MLIKLQEWIHKISDDDRKRLAHVFRFDSNPREVLDLMGDLRQRYNFIPDDALTTMGNQHE
jgi:hypothetical protein